MNTVATIVIGAGPAGLSAAAALLRGGAEPLVLEAAPRVGGSILTHRENGYIVEGGPNSLMLENDGVEAFFRELGLVPLEAAAAGKKRFLVCGGRPVAAPSGVLEAITTPLLSLRGKLRILAEPFARRAPGDGGDGGVGDGDGVNAVDAGNAVDAVDGDVDESVADFVRRRLGAEAAARLVDPMVAGIYAGDIEKLSLRSAFPRLRQMERQYGSLVRAGLAKGRAAPVRRIVNFPGGMADIPETLARFLGPERVKTGVKIAAVAQAPGGWLVEWADNSGATFRATARRLILATPPFAWAAPPLPAALAARLRPWGVLEAPPLAIVSLGYARDRVAHPLDGFGMLSPRVEGRKILGTLFQSSLFPDRAPEGRVLLTSFVGGSRAPELARLGEAALVDLVRAEMEALVGASGAPEFAHVSKWERAIPQYGIGFSRLQALLDAAEAEFPGLHFCGNYRAGVALPKTILHAIGVAGKIAAAG